MTKENFKKDIAKDALEEKFGWLLFELTDYRFDTEEEAFNFITAIRELIKEYELSDELLDKVCLLTSAKCKYFLCLETDKETVMEDTTFFGENIRLVATW